MKNLIIEATEFSPKVILDISGIIDIRGDSFPENTYEFYKPVMHWIEEYLNKPENGKCVVNIAINYFNSSSSQLFFDLFDLFEEAAESGKTVEVNWIYHSKNGSAKEAGEDFLDEFKSVSIHLIET